MKNTIALTRTKNTVSATYLPYTSYKRAIELATALKGKIGENADKTFKATFSSAKVAEKFVTEWTAEYNANRKVEVAPTPTQKPKASKGTNANNFVVVTVDGKEFLVDASALVPAKPKASKGKTASSTKKATAPKTSAPKKSTTSSKKAPSKAKGEAFNFGKIKGKTNADKNKALHKELVKMGLKDSRTHEYMSVWNARPWA